MHSLASLQSSLPTNDSFQPNTTWANTQAGNATHAHALGGYPAPNHLHHFNDVAKTGIHYNSHLSAGKIN